MTRLEEAREAERVARRLMHESMRDAALEEMRDACVGLSELAAEMVDWSLALVMQQKCRADWGHHYTDLGVRARDIENKMALVRSNQNTLDKLRRERE